MKIFRHTINILALLLASITALYTQNTATQDERTGLRLGINAGAAWQNSDIKAIPGAGFGATLEIPVLESTNSPVSFGIRGRYLHSATLGKDLTQSVAVLNNSALNGTNDPNLNYVGRDFYANHRTAADEFSLELLIKANQLRKKTGILLYAFGGLGVNTFKAKYDHKDPLGQAYDYSLINGTSTTQVRSELSLLRDENYETSAFSGRKSTFAGAIGIGIGYQISPGFSLGFEHKTTFLATDLFDGQVWNEVNLPSSSNDLYHYSSFFLNFDLFRSNITPAPKPVSPPISTQPPLYRPEIVITSPNRNPYTTGEDCTLRLVARINHVQRKSDITVRINGVAISPISYNFNTVNGILHADIRLPQEESTLEIIASNKGGRDIAQIVLRCPTPQQLTPLPEIIIENPTTETITVQDCRAYITGRVRNITDKRNLNVRINGSRLNPFDINFNPSTGQFSITTNILEGENNFEIIASNEAGNATAFQRIICQPIIQVPPPSIQITYPQSTPFIMEGNCDGQVNALIYNIAFKNDITILHNGNRITENRYQFDPVNGRLNIQIPILRGENQVEITAINETGIARATQILVCRPRQQLPLPEVIIVKPMNGSQFEGNPNCTVEIRAQIRNVNGKRNITFTQNGQIVNPASFSFNPNNGLFSALTTLSSGINIFEVSASNEAGIARDRTSLECFDSRPPLPEINITFPNSNPFEIRDANCKTRISAIIRNINSRRSITFKQNGQVLSRESFTFNPTTGRFTSEVTLIEGQNIFELVATNSAGRDETRQAIRCTPPQLPLPEVNIIVPATNPLILEGLNCNVHLEAIVRNVRSKTNIRIKRQGQIIDQQMYTFNPVSGKLVLDIEVSQGENQFEIIATNTQGQASDATKIICKASQPAPEITIITPTSDPARVDNCNTTMKARVKHVRGKQDIQVYKDNKLLPPSYYSYNTGNQMLEISLVLTPGQQHFIKIIATTDIGSDQAGRTISCPAPTPSPIVTIRKPVANPAEFEDCSAEILAQILHISGKQDIQVSLNGRPQPASAYSYNAGTKQLSIQVNMLPSQNYKVIITATNISGSDSKSVTVRCKAPKPKPVINVLEPGETPAVLAECKGTLRARILNINGIQDITITMDGRVVPRSQYIFVASTNEVSMPLTLVQARRHNIVITAKNSSGTAEERLQLSCAPPMPKPIIQVTTPRNSPTEVPNCNTQIIANILHISGKQDIQVSLNGARVNTSQYSYDINSKTFRYNIQLTPNRQNRITITANNRSGSANASVELNCTPPLPKPTVTITNPGNNPASVEDCNTTVTATVKHVSQKQDINITMDRRAVSQSNFSFDAQRGIVRVNVTLSPDKLSKLTISVRNASGEASDIVQLKCPAPTPKPVITLIHPKNNTVDQRVCHINLVIKIEHISGKQNIRATLNGQVISPNDYRFNTNSKHFTMFLNFEPNMENQFVITATNTAGSASETIKLQCVQETGGNKNKDGEESEDPRIKSGENESGSLRGRSK